jgi:hypothetical protein
MGGFNGNSTFASRGSEDGARRIQVSPPRDGLVRSALRRTKSLGRLLTIINHYITLPFPSASYFSPY